MKDFFIATIGAPAMFLFCLALWSQMISSYPYNPIIVFVLSFYPMVHFLYLCLKRTKVTFIDVIGIGIIFAIIGLPNRKEHL